MRDFFRVTEVIGALTGKSRSIVDTFGVHSDVEVITRDRFGIQTGYSFQHNLRTNVGANFWHAQLFGSASASNVAKNIALTTDATAPSAADTTLASEETTNGLGRAAGGLSHSGGATSTLISNAFTYLGSTTKVIAKVGLFDQIAGGTLVLETLLSTVATVNTSGDSVTVNWTVNY